MEPNRRALVALAYVIVIVFVASGFAQVATPPRSDVSDDVMGARISTIPPAQAHWDMSTLRDGKIQNLADASGATDGIMYNTVPSSNGAIGGSMDFNGNSAAVDCPDPNNLLKSDSGTVSAWIKSTGKPTRTAVQNAAFVILENGATATLEDKEYLGRLAVVFKDMYSVMVHGQGSVEIDPMIYVQTPVQVNPISHTMEVNNFLTLGNPDIYDFIFFFYKMQDTTGTCMMNFKNTVHGIGLNIFQSSLVASKYVTGAATIGYMILQEKDTKIDWHAYVLTHEFSHAYCARWDYMVGDVKYNAPVDETGYHYVGKFRTDLHSALGGFGWLDNHDGTWTANADLIPIRPDGPFDDTDYNLDEYTFGLIPASDVRPAHLLVSDEPGYFGSTITATDSVITVDQIIAADGPWWNEEDRQCIMLRCTNQYGDVFRGQGWGLFVGTVPPNDHIYWYSGSADGAVEWRYGSARVCDGAWHDVTVSFTGTTGRLYVDGVLDIQWVIHPVAAANNVHTVIGCEDPTSPYHESWFSGSIDDVYVFNSVLTDWEVRQLYDSPPTTPGVPQLQTPGDESDGTFTLTWTGATDPDLTPVEGYYVGESTYLGDGTWSAWHMAGGPTASTSMTFTRAPGSYIYRVCAFDTADWYSGWATMSQQQPIVVPEPPGPPVTTATLSGTMGLNGWYTTEVKVTLTATDPDGIKETKYSLDGGRWATYRKAITVSASGSHSVEFYSTDNLGYVETTRSVAFKIDKDPPATSSKLTGKLDRKLGMYNPPVTVTLTATDVGSGVAITQYSLDGGLTWSTYTTPLTFSTSGSHTVTYKSTDLAGNVESPGSVSFTIK